MANRISVMIADDSKLTILGLNTTFKHFADEIDVLGSAENGMIAVNMCKEMDPDIVLMDIGMPIMDGIQATKQLKKLKLRTKVIMLTSHDSQQDVLDALSAGAHSYCMKDISPEILIAAIKSTHNGASWLDPAIAKIVLGSLSSGTSATSKNNDVQLTDRETEILNLIAQGYSNSAISETLFISMNTVKTHIKNIFQKLEVEDRTHAAMKAFGQMPSPMKTD